MPTISPPFVIVRQPGWDFDQAPLQNLGVAFPERSSSAATEADASTDPATPQAEPGAAQAQRAQLRAALPPVSRSPALARTGVTLAASGVVSAVTGIGLLAYVAIRGSVGHAQPVQIGLPGAISHGTDMPPDTLDFQHHGATAPPHRLDDDGLPSAFAAGLAMSVAGAGATGAAIALLMQARRERSAAGAAGNVELVPTHRPELIQQYMVMLGDDPQPQERSAHVIDMEGGSPKASPSSRQS